MIKTLHFIYSTSIFSWLRILLTGKAFFSRCAGFYCNRSISKLHIQPFIERHNLNAREFKKNVHEFTSFNDFFIRELHETARTIDTHEHSIISPADGTLSVIPNLFETKTFAVKQQHFSLEHFLRDTDLASQYHDGVMLSVRLSPWDYHRFHFPATCTPTEARFIKGNYHSVNPLVFDYNINPFVENERSITMLHTVTDTIIMVTVGALFVGSIVHTYQPHSSYGKGDQAGYFCFGGSTIVLIFKKNTLQLNTHLIKQGVYDQEIPIKMGQSLGNVII